MRSASSSPSRNCFAAHDACHNADERIPVDTALRAVTIDAAWQCRADDITGSIEVGKFADVVLLEDDPHTVDPTTIAKIAVSEPRPTSIRPRALRIRGRGG